MPRTFTRRFWTTDATGRQVEAKSEIALDLDALELTGDVEADASTVAGNIGMIAELLGDYEERATLADAKYRTWRSQKFLEFSEPADGGKKPSVEAVKAMVEADDGFWLHKSKVASIEGALKHLEGYKSALEAKGRMVAVVQASRGRQNHAENGLDTRENGHGGRSVTRPPDYRETMEKSRKAREEE